MIAVGLIAIPAEYDIPLVTCFIGVGILILVGQKLVMVSSKLMNQVGQVWGHRRRCWG